MTEAERAQAVAEFFAWPAPAIARTGARPRLRQQLLASLIALTIGATLAVCSLALPITAAAGDAWGGGAHLSLFCHLSL